LQSLSGTLQFRRDGARLGGSLGSHISREKGYLLKNREETKELHKKVNYLSENSRIQRVPQEELHFFFQNTLLSVEKLPIRLPEEIQNQYFF
jgi:hypothetical protein